MLKGIAGVTEETSGLLASYLNSVCADVSFKRALQEKFFIFSSILFIVLDMLAITLNKEFMLIDITITQDANPSEYQLSLSIASKAVIVPTNMPTTKITTPIVFNKSSTQDNSSSLCFSLLCFLP